MTEESFPEPGAVRAWRAVLPVTVQDDLAVELPTPIRWALSLNEGGLLTAEMEEWEGWETVSARFRSYERLLRVAVEGCADPWPYILEALALPMGRILAGGAVELPEEVAARLSCGAGDRLLLRTWSQLDGPSFTLQRDEEGRAVPELYVEASYPLRVEADGRVFPPADALRFLPQPPEAFHIPPFLRDCARVRLSVILTGQGAALQWDAYAEL